MSENLRTTRESDGLPILKVRVTADWTGNPDLSAYAAFVANPRNDQNYDKLDNGNAVCCGIYLGGCRYLERDD